MNDLISVIVPIYKVEKYIRKCVDSIISQTYTNIEIILVDDGSPDGCPQICDEYAKQDSRVVVIHKQNGGLSSARNAGLDIAKGSYISFIDSDDYVSCDFIKNLYSQIQKDNSDMVLCEFEMVDEAGNLIGHHRLPQNNITNWREFWDKFVNGYDVYCVVSWNKLYKAHLWKELRFPNGKINEDSFVIVKLLQMCSQISMLNTPMYYYLQRRNSIMKSFGLKNLDGAEACIHTYDYFMALKEYLYAQYFLSLSSWTMIQGFIKLDMRDEKTKNRYDELYNAYKNGYKNLKGHRIKNRAYVNSTLYYYSPHLYAVFYLLLVVRNKLYTKLYK